MNPSIRFTASLIVLAFLCTLPRCKKKEEDDSTTTYLLAALLFSSTSRAYAGSCNKFSVNSTCFNSFGTFVASSCTAAGGTVQTTKCSGTNFGACTTTSGAAQTVYLSGGTSPVCTSTGTCSTDCTSVLGTYSSTYTPYQAVNRRRRVDAPGRFPMKEIAPRFL